MEGDDKKFKTIHNTYVKNGRSDKQKADDLAVQFMESISPSLKKMKISYYESI